MLGALYRHSSGRSAAHHVGGSRSAAKRDNQGGVVGVEHFLVADRACRATMRSPIRLDRDYCAFPGFRPTLGQLVGSCRPALNDDERAALPIQGVEGAIDVASVAVITAATDQNFQHGFGTTDVAREAREMQSEAKHVL